VIKDMRNGDKFFGMYVYGNNGTHKGYHPKRNEGDSNTSEIESNVDWANVRIQTAIAFGQALINGSSYRMDADVVAEKAVSYADALVKRLKK
jgi:hypothetical protein